MKTCPICKAVESTFPILGNYHRNDGDFQLFECPHCHVQFWLPFKNPGPEWYATCEQNLKHRASTDKEFLLWQAQQRCITRHFFLHPLPGKRLLDIGCGTGGFLVEAKKCGYEVFGVDFDEEQVSVARSLQVPAVAEDIFSFLENNREPYDIITGFEIIEHLDQPKRFLELIHRNLRPGGYVVLTTPNRRRVGPRNEFWDFPYHHLSRWNAPSLKRLVEQVGFRGVRVKEELPLRYLVAHLRLGIVVRIRAMKPPKDKSYKDSVAKLGSLKDRVVGFLLLPLALVLFFLGKKGQGLYLMARK